MEIANPESRKETAKRCDGEWVDLITDTLILYDKKQNMLGEGLRQKS
jgi:hypothetical protein